MRTGVPIDPLVMIASPGDIFGDDEVARAANNHEKTMSSRFAIRYYYVAMFWVMLMALPIIFVGYETELVTNFFSYEPFKKTYGWPSPDGKGYTIPPTIKSTILHAAAAGQLVGLLLANFLVPYMEYRISRVVSLIGAAVFLQIGPYSMDEDQPLIFLFIGEFLLGIPWGVLQGITLVYVSDITPLKLRAPATAMIHLYRLIGQLLSVIILLGSREIKSIEWSIKLPMFIQYSWLLPLALIACMAPESPLVLTKVGNDELAKETLRRLNRDPMFSADGSLAVIKAVNNHEAVSFQYSGLFGCFTRKNLRRTEIAVIAYVTQQLVGLPLISYSVDMMCKYVLTHGHALHYTIGIYVLGIISTISSMVLMQFVGRRKLWLGGLLAIVTCLVSIGSLSYYWNDGFIIAKWVLVILPLLLVVVYNFTIGPVCYTIVSETPATRLKLATICIAGMENCTLSVLNLYLAPTLFDQKPIGLGLRSRAAFVWAFTAMLCLIWAFFRLPEMKGRTPMEIDVLFDRSLPARRWRNAVI